MRKTAVGQATLFCQCDQLFGIRPEFLRLGQRRRDLLMLDERSRHVAQHRITVRGGALLDAAGHARWQLVPISGASVLRDMVRATALSAGRKTAELAATARAVPTRLAGNVLHPLLYAALSEAEIVGDAQLAALAGTPWRRAEPGDDDAFVAAMVADIVDWSKTCVAR